MSEVDSIVWPNPEFDNNITVYGPEVRALVQRYLVQMLDELRALPHPAGRADRCSTPSTSSSPTRRTRRWSSNSRRAAGLRAGAALLQHRPGREHVLRQHPASPSHDAVRDGVIDRPMRVFAPGFGAGAVGGYVVLRVDPAVVG